MAPAITILVGVPIRVETPPMEALYAIESIKAFAKVLCSPVLKLGFSCNCLMMTIPIGNIITELADTTASYGHKLVFLTMGGFIIAIAIEKWDLHKRIALNIIHYIGTDIKKIILGFMIATAFLSMWISNTATSVMMLPIGIVIIKQLQENPNFSTGEQKLRGGGVSACAVCDGFFYKGQEVAVVGGGDTAAEEATYLANICSKVTVLVRKDKMRASKAMQHRVTNTPNIDLRYNHEIDEVLGNQVVEGLRIINNKTREKEEIKITGLFIAIGHKPNTEIFQGQLDMDDDGYLTTNGKSTKTNLPGVFASGDVQDKEYRQAVTAAGTGCMAALDAERYLQTL